MLPKNEKTFTISVIGEISKERYEGTFSCVCVPTGGIRNGILRDETREAGDMTSIPNELFYRAKWLANVKWRVLEAPEWWRGTQNGLNLLDDNILKEVYDKCLEAEIEWREKVATKNTAETPTPTA
jgi:hypothetical protein